MQSQIDKATASGNAAKKSLTTDDICLEFFGGYSRGSFWRYRQTDKTFPAAFKLGGRPLWNRAEVQAWYDKTRAAQTEAA